jgi:hypothetical protein
MRKLLGSSFLFLVVAFGAPHPASAGGWAVVTLDPQSATPVAGVPVAVGFTILQHGVTPYVTQKASIVIFDGAGHTEQFVAAPAGDPGHHVAQVTFPTAGVWHWEIQPDWFPVQELGEVTVTAAAASATAAAPASNATSTATLNPEPPIVTTTTARESVALLVRVLLGVALAGVVVLAAIELGRIRRHAPA